MISWIQFQSCLYIIFEEMYSRFFRRLLSPMLSSAFLGLATLAFAPTLTSKGLKDKLSLFSNKIQCLETIRANKPELVKLIQQTKTQLIILIYNRQSQSSLKQAILKLEQLISKVGVQKMVLVDQTDVRHLQAFTRILRKDVDQDDKNRLIQPVNLEGKIKIVYVNPIYNTMKPFMIQSSETLVEQIKQIRKFLKINPTEEQLKKSLGTYNCTSVIKNCYNQTCIDQYAEKVRQLIQTELLREKGENFAFFVTTAKNQAAKVAGIINQTSNKQEIYVFRNDMLGKSRDLQSEFKEKEGSNYQSKNKFMMMIRPRVHIISKKTLNTDLFWYISSLRCNPVPTFSINNTLNNLPAKIIEKTNENIVWLKGHPQQVDLIRKIKQKHGKNIEVLILQSNVPSQLIRHVYQAQRYCIFSISPTVPYPKLLIKPPTLNIPLNSWVKLEKIDSQNPESYKLKDPTEYGPWNQQKWSRVMEKINTYMAKPKNYSNVKMYRQKQMEINADEFQKILNSKQNKQKWVFRVCGQRNNCLYSAYQKYGLNISTPVYKLDSQVQNVDLKQGDYEVEGSTITMIQ